MGSRVQILRNQFPLIWSKLDPWVGPMSLHLGSPNHELFFFGSKPIDFPTKMEPCSFSLDLPLLVLYPHLKGRRSNLWLSTNRISPNFDLKNMISTYVQRILHGKNGRNSPEAIKVIDKVTLCLGHSLTCEPLFHPRFACSQKVSKIRYWSFNETGCQLPSFYRILSVLITPALD
jgi:hypothetical protein